MSKQPACPHCKRTTYDIYRASTMIHSLKMGEDETIETDKELEKDFDGYYFDCCYTPASEDETIAYLKSIQ